MRHHHISPVTFTRISSPRMGAVRLPVSERPHTSNADRTTAGREGIFTFTTDANLVMQNNEAGTAPGPGTKVVWTITPTTKAVPTAVVRF